MLQSLPASGVLRVVPEAQLQAALKAQEDQRAKQALSVTEGPVASALASHIRTRFEVFRQHRNNSQSGYSERLIAALRAFNGQYDPAKLAEIAKFRGSQVYARLVATKCRGASALLRDVYVSPDRPWGLAAPEDPDIPPEIIQSIRQLVDVELQTNQQAGVPTDVNAIRDRAMGLMEAAREAAKKKAAKQARVAEDKIDELLVEGNFYKALAEFLVDLPLFVFACIKGPVVRVVPTVTWNSGRASIAQKPRLFWQRVSPFDIWFTPGVADIEDADVIERTRVTRAELNDLLDLPGYNQKEVRAVLDEYGRGGIADNWDNTDAERAVQENRENPQWNQSGLLTCLEFHGNVQGRMLIDYGMDTKQVPDPLRDYMIQGWLIGNHVIKVQMSPSPRKRHPYFITSFEKVPGTPVGNGLPDILGDVQDVCNATLRALVNNLSISSGPQVVVNDDRLAMGEDGEEMFPWKRWHVTSDPMGNNTQEPITFFQPQANADELIKTYEWLNGKADEISAIPKYLSGNNPGGGAGRTASGLAMLMGNASKVLQTVAANIDRDVLEPLLSNLFDMILLTDESGFLTGQEQVRVLGVNVAVQRETQRSRQLEFLQITANPVDTQIIGPRGRAAVLRAVSQGVGLDGEEIVPSDETLEAQQHAQQMSQMQPGQPGQSGQLSGPNGAAEAGAQAQGSQRGPASSGDMGPRTNLQQRQPGMVSGGVH